MYTRYFILAVTVCCFFAAICIMGCSKNSVGDDVDVDDGIAPSVVLDLAVYQFSDSSVTLTWTAPGDDTTSGTATAYDLRVSSSVIHWGNFDSAQQISGVPSPQPAGSAEQFEVTGLQMDSTYHFALRTYDENGNYEGVSNCVSATCFNDFVVNISDDGLLAAIREQLTKPSGSIYKSDLMALTELDASNRGISDLSGLEYCVNMVILDIYNNAISDLTPLEDLAELVQLRAGENEIGDATPLSALTELNSLNLRNNEITDLSPLIGLTLLRILDLQGNRVGDISACTGLAELEHLNCAGNAVRDIAPLVSNSGLGSGDVVSLHLNPLTHESIMVHIPTLRGRGVTVSWIDNTAPPLAVSDLSVDTIAENSVRLSWTAPGEDYSVGIAYQYELRYSTARAEVEDWTGGTTVSGMPVPDTAGTRQYADVTSLATDSMYYFSLKTQDNSENWSEVSNITWARPFSDDVVVFADAALEGVIRGLISKPSGDIYRSELTMLDTIVADNQGITDLTGLEYCVNLMFLHLIDNDISQIDQLSGLIGLYDLNLQGNSISDISPLASLSNLLVLQLSGNPCGDITPLSSLSQLRLLAASFCGISSLQPVSSLTGLQYLFIAGNSISDISPLTSCPQLMYFVADYNSIQQITSLSGLLQLASLSLTNNQVQDVGPLVSNSGLGAGDMVALENNPLSTESINVHIPALEARGVTVTF